VKSWCIFCCIGLLVGLVSPKAFGGVNQLTKVTLIPNPTKVGQVTAVWVEFNNPSSPGCFLDVDFGGADAPLFSFPVSLGPGGVVKHLLFNKVFMSPGIYAFSLKGVTPSLAQIQNGWEPCHGKAKVKFTVKEKPKLNFKSHRKFIPKPKLPGPGPVIKRKAPNPSPVKPKNPEPGSMNR